MNFTHALCLASRSYYVPTTFLTATYIQRGGILGCKGYKGCTGYTGCSYYCHVHPTRQHPWQSYKGYKGYRGYRGCTSLITYIQRGGILGRDPCSPSDPPLDTRHTTGAPQRAAHPVWAAQRACLARSLHPSILPTISATPTTLSVHHGREFLL